jgi:hypothetical protein
MGWHVVWIEAKIDAEEQPNQLLDYRTELLRRYPTGGSLVALGRDGSEILTTALERHLIPPLEEPTQLAEAVSWEQLAKTLDQVGADRAGGARWRHDANQPATLAVQRTLYDFLHFLEIRGLAMNDDPLTLTDGLVASRGRQLFDKHDGLISRLLTLAGDRIAHPVGDVADPWYWPGAGDFCSAQGRCWSLGAEAWPVLINPTGESTAQLWFRTTDEEDRPRDARNQALFFASLVVDPAPAPVIAAFDNPEWRTSLPPDVAVVTRKREARVSKLRYLGEIASVGITLPQQAQDLAEWASTSLTELLSLAPPPVPADL